MASSEQEVSAAACPPTADFVGNAFVHQYYLILHQSPKLVHRFYKDISKLGRPEENGAMSITTTMQAINEKILSLHYCDLSTEILTVDAQDSFNGGVLVLVTGHLTGKDSLRRKFSQSFFLAPQDKGYFVLNDVFRYVDEGKQGLVNDVETPPSPDLEPSSVEHNYISEPATADHISEPATADHISEAATADHISEPATADHISGPATADHISEPATADHISEPATADHISEPATADHISEPATADHISEPATADHISEPATADHISEPATADHISEPATADHISEPATAAPIDKKIKKNNNHSQYCCTYCNFTSNLEGG